MHGFQEVVQRRDGKLSRQKLLTALVATAAADEGVLCIEATQSISNRGREGEI